MDTNILVSSLLAAGPPAIIIDLAVLGKIVPVYSDSILCEYWEVLSREKFGFSSFQVTHLMHDIVRIGISIEDKPMINDVSDEDDMVFYNAAVESAGYIVTGNIRHFPKESFIVTPAKFLTIYRMM